MSRSGHIDIYGRTFSCECGRFHAVRPKEVIYGDDALARLAEVCSRHAAGRHAAVVMDRRTRQVAGAAAAEALADAGWDVQEILAADPPGGSCVCDDATKADLAVELGPADLLVAVGSGVISDLTKWLAFEADTPYVAFATAASMNGYTSANVAPTVRGVKTLLRARPPAAVLALPAVLAQAPYEMTAAGLGDALAKSVSSVDWYLNHRLFGDDYCQRSIDLVADIEPLYLDRPGDLRRRRPEAVAALFDALLLTGVAMTLAGTSAPASGAEHLISHSLDMMSSLDGLPHDLHGRQVGLATVLTAELYRRVVECESPDLHEPPGGVDRAFWGRLADVVAEKYAQKLDRLHAARGPLATGGAWDDLRADLAGRLRTPARIHRCLAAAGAACRAEDIGCDRDRLAAAFYHAHEIRSRFTVLDLARLLGVLPDAVDEILEAWA